MNNEASNPRVDAVATTDKRTYRKPEFVAHGAIEEVTLGSGSTYIDGAAYSSSPS